MKSGVVRVQFVTRPFDVSARQARFGHGEPCPGHEGLRGPDTGQWAGRSFDEVAAEDPDGIRRWLTDPAYAPPGGGESLAGLVARVGAALAGLPAGTHRPVVEQAVVRAAVVYALELPLPAFWRLDARPDTVTTLTGRAGRWNLLLGQGGQDGKTGNPV
ncbi:histidine phosphatase family protein [Streptomyces sp. BR123]|uniref:histidine phosphatase family protein n=1 Tax=Streptomyces sp. BR123 TaxID=2749828 RepID=UPI0015C4C893|nr:histidine phosphatase family protein [Streptomyces sp. BR123]NXY96550.1 histidine phosphatase family protein [Streptomyces sp. BR123]